jgi:hypothetical protein
MRSTAPRCEVCATPLGIHDIGGTCRSLACRAALTIRARKRSEEEGRAAAARAAAALAEAHPHPDGIVVGVVPFVAAECVPADPARIAAFRASLEQAAREALGSLDAAGGVVEPACAAFGRLEGPPEAPGSAHETPVGLRDAGGAPEPAGGSPLAAEPPARALAACGVCGGRCCWQGDTHAFLTPRDLAAKFAQAPPASPAAAVAAYMERLPERSYEGSCVFHARDGCALPRRMRSDVCNGYRCPGLAAFAAAVQAAPAAPAYVAAVHAGEVRRGLLLDPPAG